jgi:hypothetical protein
LQLFILQTEKKVVVVALAAVVILPAFAQVTVAEEVQSVLPAGEELLDTELLGAEGEVAPILVALLGAGIAGGAAAGGYSVGCCTSLDPGEKAAAITAIGAASTILIWLCDHYLLSDR